MSEDESTIPEVAVRAAVLSTIKSLRADGMGYVVAEQTAEMVIDVTDFDMTAAMRAALKAAAPHMLAAAWDEGEEAGGLNRGLEEYPHLEQAANPYRTAK